MCVYNYVTLSLYIYILFIYIQTYVHTVLRASAASGCNRFGAPGPDPPAARRIGGAGASKEDKATLWELQIYRGFRDFRV